MLSSIKNFEGLDHNEFSGKKYKLSRKTHTKEPFEMELSSGIKTSGLTRENLDKLDKLAMLH